MISLSEAQIVDWLSPILWPFLRVLAVFTAAPVFSSRAFPVRARIGLAFLIAYAAQASMPEQPVISINGPDALGAVVQQVGIGLAIGFAVRLIFGQGPAQPVGPGGVLAQIVSQQCRYQVGVAHAVPRVLKRIGQLGIEYPLGFHPEVMTNELEVLGAGVHHLDDGRIVQHVGKRREIVDGQRVEEIHVLAADDLIKAGHRKKGVRALKLRVQTDHVAPGRHRVDQSASVVDPAN